MSVIAGNGKAVQKPNDKKAVEKKPVKATKK